MTPEATAAPDQAFRGEFGRAKGGSEPRFTPGTTGEAAAEPISAALRLAWLPIALFVLLAAFFYWRAEPGVLGDKRFAVALHLVCITFASFFVASLAARSHFARPSMSILFMGGGALTLGLAGLFTATAIWSSPSVNDWATIYRGSAFLGAAWHFAGALFDLRAPHMRVRRPWLVFATCYLGAFFAVGALLTLLRLDMTPVFFVANSGATPFCKAVTTTGAAMFLASAWILCQRCGEHVAFRRWYGYGLALFAVSLVVGSMQMNMGDALNWTNRSAKSLGGVYLAVAAVVYIRETGVWMLPAELALRSAEEQLRLANERLALALRAGRAFFFDWDMTGGVESEVFATSEMRELFETAPCAEAEGAAASGGRIDAAGLAEFRAILRGCLEERRREFDFKFRAVSPGDGVRWLACQGRIDYNGSGAPTRMTGIAIDDTARKLAEEALVELNRELERRVEIRAAELERVNAELEGFAYSVSHDLRTPLRAIHGFARVLYDEYGEKFDGEGRREIQAIQDATVQMSGIIDDLLNFSRLLRETLLPEDVDLGELAQEVFDKLSKGAPGRRFLFSAGKTPLVRCDRRLMRIALGCLLSNAIRFTASREVAEISFSAAAAGPETIYTVGDNGAGFDMKQRHKLFGVFQRLHEGAGRGGAGVGLATVKRILDLHGGRVWGEGTPGAGAAFHFVLPADPSSHVSQLPAAEASLNPPQIP